MQLDPELAKINIPRDEEGPVFEEPWQAQAFALTVKLHEAKQFTWSEWAEIFGAEIAADTSAGNGVGNTTYYLCWLAALEKIVAQKELLTPDQLKRRKAEWQDAADHTPHGQPITLEKTPE
ncbi:nitrile hydratase accessory protein [uncultured Sneathiella sp.]|uniref:nitrile hydratase accessory protein n=1 Tax=uncultured Sneathiella sp. TaxID=879315 RepID=UPI0030EB90F1|tara:strand:+ start:59363 stop:59725 length:363 start_codon:yes stop_codon:yes gene_type:complete